MLANKLKSVAHYFWYFSVQSQPGGNLLFSAGDSKTFSVFTCFYMSVPEYALVIKAGILSIKCIKY